MIEVKVEVVGSEMDSNSPVLILANKKESGILPMKIDPRQAIAIYLALEDKDFPRPMTHDLISNIFDKCKIEVLDVEIVDLKEGTYFANIKIKQNGQIKRIDSRPSDAIAVALREEVSIHLSEDVAEENFIYADPYEFVEPFDFKIMNG